MLQNFEQEFEQIASTAWDRSKSPLERMHDCWVGEGQLEPDPPKVTFRIYNHEGPIPCHLCRSTDEWVAEGDEVRQIVRVFVCEHEPVSIGRGAIRQVSSVPAHKVSHIEETSRPLE